MTWLRVLILALALPLMSAGALPVWAYLFGVEGPHVCHCSVDKHDCVCVRCHTDHAANDFELLTSRESLKGRCGDDEVAFGGKAIQLILPAGLVLPPIAERALIIGSNEAPPLLIASRPPTPPPRSLGA